jgi:competence protein ComEA
MLAVTHSTAIGSPQTPKDDLPDGDGKQILLTSCTACHDLTEVTKFRGYYTRDEWRDIVRTMVEYGAKVQDKDIDVLVDYLAKNFGKATEERR